MPTRSELSIVIAVASALSSIPVDVNVAMLTAPKDIAVPEELNIASIASRSAFSLVPQLSVDAPTSGLVKLQFVVVVSAIILILYYILLH